MTHAGGCNRPDLTRPELTDLKTRAERLEGIGKVVAKCGYLGVPDSSEAGLVVTGAGTARQKFQKFFTPEEFRDMLLEFFDTVELTALDGLDRDPSIVGVCRHPRRAQLAAGLLETALKFEFDMKIEDEKLARSDAAIAAFRRARLFPRAASRPR